jgi:NADP-dependent 3-hydroxy acid dehydrogenase YdfG
VTEVLPGAVRTEFGLVRKGISPLTADDVAECVRWAVALPPHVNVDRIDVRPVRQGGAAMFARDS